MKKGIFVIITFLSLLAIAGTAIADAEFDTALKDYYLGHYKNAVIRLKAHVSKKPDPASYYLIGYSLYKLGRFREAAEYFDQAYLIDPGFSPEQLGLGKAPPEIKAKKRIRKRAASRPAAARKRKAAMQKVKPSEEENAAAGPQKAAAAPLKREAKSTAASSPSPSSQSGIRPQKPEPKEKQPAHVLPSPKIPPAPSAKKDSPGIAPLLALPLIVGSFLAGFFFIAVAVGIASYVYYALCLFMIAKKRKASYPWTAWVPLVQVWPIVESAGKPAWWIFLLLVPIVNLIVWVYLWMCIAENLGRNKWLGFLMIIPLINFVFLGILAFSESAQSDRSFGLDMPE